MSRRRRKTPDEQARLIFDPVAGEALKQDGIARADRGAEPTWAATADAVVRILCRRVDRDGAAVLQELTTDDLWRELAAQKMALPREPRALGAVMLRAARGGWIKKTDRVRPSDRAANHRRPVAVWLIVRRV